MAGSVARPPAGTAKRDGAPAVSLPALFMAFLKVGICGFAGGLVWARRAVVERQRWLDDREFAELLGFCQFMPGPNIASITVCVGARLRGLPGAATALAGFILIPWTVGFSLGVVILDHTGSAIVQHALTGISASAAGLMIGTGIRLLLPHRREPEVLLLAALTLVLAVAVRLPLFAILAAVVPIGIASAAYRDAGSE